MTKVMTLKEQIVADMKMAMRDKETEKLQTIRLLRAAIQRQEVDAQAELDDAGVLQILEKMVKQCADAAEQFERGARPDLAAREHAGRAILEGYLPRILDTTEVAQLITEAMAETGAQSRKDMGKVLAQIKTRAQAAQARVDMAAVSEAVKTRLAG